MTEAITVHFDAAPRKIRARQLPSLAEMPAREQAVAQGYIEGWTKAYAECRKEMEERIQVSRAHWDAVARSLNALPSEVVLRLQEQLVDLAFSTVRKILAATPVTREEIAGQVKQMIEKVEAGAEIEIQLNPEDMALLTEEDRAALWNENLTHLKWAPNPSIDRGGCMLRGEFGWMDGRRGTRVARLEQLARESLKESR